MVLGWCRPSSMLRSLGNGPRTTEKECVKQIGRQRKATRNSALMSAGRPVMALVLINRRWVSSVDSSMFTSWGHLLSCIIDNWKASVWRYYIFLLLVFSTPISFFGYHLAGAVSFPRFLHWMISPFVASLLQSFTSTPHTISQLLQ